MLNFVIKRILMTLLVVLGAAILIFTIMYFVPGDPATVLLGDTASAADLEALRVELGLRDPYLVRLGRFLYDTFIRLDLGTSYFSGRSVATDLAMRVPRTAILGVSCVIFSTIVAIPLGIAAAIHQNRWQDSLCMIITMTGSAVPSFWMALLLVLLFSVRLNILPSFGIGGIPYYIMPVIANSYNSIAHIARQTRSSMLEVMRADFVTSARAKGVRERKVKYRHMLPNALMPVITVIGHSFARCVAGTVVIETVFTIPGVGTYLMNAVTSRDYPIVLGGVVFLAAMVSVITLLTDLSYGFIDPRIRAQYSGGQARRMRREAGNV